MNNIMDIKLLKNFKYTSGDCISHFDATFETNPTLEEFVDWLLTKNSKEWGYVYNKRFFIFVEYSCGNIVKLCDNYNEIKNKKISLHQMHGGWSCMDYTIKIEK